MLFYGHFLLQTIFITLFLKECSTNLPPSFTHDMNNFVLSENTSVGQVIFTLEGSDPENSSIHFGIVGTDLFKVNEITGEVTIVKPLDHEVNSTLKFFVTIEDEVENAPVGGNNIVKVPVTIIILDENDNVPVFKNVPYIILIKEDTVIETTIFSEILVTDADTVGNSIEVECINLPDYNDTCDIFNVVTIDSAQSSFHGALILKRKVDFKIQQKYQLLLRATDGDLDSTTLVTINVEDVQNTPPIFTSPSYAEVNEDAPINTLVLEVHAEDGDWGMPRSVFYELINNPMDYFIINSNTGEVRTARPLDRESVANSLGKLNIKIRASEMVNGEKFNDELTVTDTEITVVIKDINDEPPTFNKDEYFVEIPEDAEYGYGFQNLLMTVNDPDVGNNSIFTLSLDDISHSFFVEPEKVVGSAEVTIRVKNNSLDYEDPNLRKFIILVVAKELYTDPQLSSTATITVTVTDANDNAPTFNMPYYTATVSEIASAGTLVTTVVAKDRDTGRFGENGIIYQITGEGSERFTVNNRTGSITVSNCDDPGQLDCLDYETKQEYLLTYKATDDDGKGQTTIVPLRITLKDSNDNSPIFSQSIYNVFIDEGIVKFKPDLIINATDPDKTSHVMYSIIAGNTDDIFDIDAKTGKMRIANNKVISFNNEHNKNKIALTVEASDGKYTTTTIVNITIRDINNNPPKFDRESYMVSLAENTEIGSSVIQLKAEDLDAGENAEITYVFKRGSFNDFTIENKTGVVYIASPLDYDRHNTYNIEVSAEDHGKPSLMSTTILTIHIINVNNKAPYFVPSTQRAEIMKNAEIGTVVHTLIAMDPDLNSSEALNFAASEPITATDKYGKIVNDNDIFKEFFSIDKSTGKVTVRSLLQRNVAAIVQISVLVTDIMAPTMQQGEGTLIITITDINDQPPRFLPPWTEEKPEYTLRVQEELPIGTILATYTAVDEDSVISGYYIKPESRYFEINTGTGILQIKERIDYERITNLNFTIIAYDSGMPQLNATALVNVIVSNINDNSPRFTVDSYNATVYENAPNGTHIITVRAVDEDANEYGVVSYSLTGQHSENFYISLKSGEISVANSNFLDYELFNETTIQVVASDGALGSFKHNISVPVFISILNVNDNAPKFNQSHYNVTVSENIRFNPSVPILQVLAVDADEGTNGNINYKIVSGNQNDVFLLGEDTGILYVHKSLIGKIRHYMIEIEARDEGGNGRFSDRTTVDVHVVNKNEHKPIITSPALLNSTIKISEARRTPLPDNLILTVKAVDSDLGESGRITYHFRVHGKNVQETDNFVINADTGVLKTKMSLDYKTIAKNQLVIVARDHGSPEWYETIFYLTIIFEEINNNEIGYIHLKNNDSYHFYVVENSKKNLLIGQIKVITTKKDPFSKVYYYIISGNENNTFFIDKLNGSLYSNKIFDREEVSKYEILVMANSEPDFYLSTKEKNEILQNGSSYNDSLVKIIVSIMDLNDNLPKFDKPVYYGGVNSMANINTFFANVSATDPDFGINGSIIYYVKTSNLYKYGSNKTSGSIVPSPFNITQDGQLFTATDLTENNQHRFAVHVVAREVAITEREVAVTVHVWIFEPDQLIRIILSRPMGEVLQEKDEIIAELSTVTKSIVVITEIKEHTNEDGQKNKDWCDMYILVVDPASQTIIPVYSILKVIDAKYDYLKDYYTGFAIMNVVPAFIMEPEESFDPAVSALIALLLVLIVGIITFTVVCCCMRQLISPQNLKKKDTLINKAIIDDLNTTENPLWIEQKLKIYEEQELSMQVFNEPEQAVLDQRNSSDFTPDDNTYATIQHPNRRGSTNTATLSLVDDTPDYATLSRFPQDLSTTNYEASMGFQGSTFQVPTPLVSD